MITAIELENFKGIGPRQRVELAPLTLLFGANSAGKSTILHALVYLSELLERGGADVDGTELGGSTLELGGFARLVHGHETGHSMVLRAEFDTPGGLERFGRPLGGFPFPDLDDQIEHAWIELTIRHHTAGAFAGPIIDRAVIGVGTDTEPLVWLETGASLREGEPLSVRVNLGHPLIAEMGREIAESWEAVAIPGEVLFEQGDGSGSGAGSGLGDGSGFGDSRSLPVFAVSRSRPSALPPLGEPLRVVSFGEAEPGARSRSGTRSVSRSRSGAKSRSTSRSRSSPTMFSSIEEGAEDRQNATEQVRTFLEMVVLGTTNQLAAALRGALYIGPLRTIPPRGYLYERPGRAGSWADGLAAWDSLLGDRTTLVERTNHWLGQDRLGSGCRVVVQDLYDPKGSAEETASADVDRTARRLLLDTGAGSFVLPSEVGAGISQVVPVVVAALEERSSIVMVEQPELHVHPAVQVGLGDLFIDTVTRASAHRQMIIETHSEHIVLRLLRRVRETGSGELPAHVPPFPQERLSVLHVQPSSEGAHIRRLRVDPSGEFIDRWPEGFFEERSQELF